MSYFFTNKGHHLWCVFFFFFFFQAEDGIRDHCVTGVQTCALPISYSEFFVGPVEAARRLGYTWINATIRADNEGGLAYYQSRGFETYQIVRDVPLAGGQRVDRVKKRFDLSNW